MAPELFLLLDHLAGGLLDVRRRLCAEGQMLLGERVDAAEHIKVAYAALINLRRILHRAERRERNGDAKPESKLLSLHKAASMLGHSPIGDSPISDSDEWASIHEEIKNTDLVWRSLAFDGLQSDGRGGLIEYRRCPHCSSTLGRRISRQDAMELCRTSAEVHARSLEALANAAIATSPAQQRNALRK